MHQVTLSDQNYIYSEVYLNSFDPNNACTNYLADSNLGPLYQVTVPGNATIFVVVEQFTEGAGCPSYTVTVNGLDNCALPMPTVSPTVTSTATFRPTATATATFTPTATANGYLYADSSSYRNVNGNFKCDCGAEQCRFPMSPKGSESREKV